MTLADLVKKNVECLPMREQARIFSESFSASAKAQEERVAASKETFASLSEVERLSAEPLEREVAGHPILIPRPEHLIALKLHSASSPDRQRPEMDWEDIRQIIRICAIDSANPALREIVLRYGGEKALRRIEPF